MRYLKQLENKDLSLTHAMIPFGVVYHEAECGDAIVAHRLGAHLPNSTRSARLLRPRARRHDGGGELETVPLREITGFAGMSLQPNSGAQGEYTGSVGDPSLPRVPWEKSHRDVCLIPSSAHGTNPASAVMCGMEGGGGGMRPVTATSIWMSSPPRRRGTHSDRLGALMITYPSTHGVFEEHILEVTETVRAQERGADLHGWREHERPGGAHQPRPHWGGRVPFEPAQDVRHSPRWWRRTWRRPHWGGGAPRAVSCRATRWMQ